MATRKKPKSKPKSKAKGDCYEAAGQYMVDSCLIGSCDLILVHGEVAGQGPLEGVTFGHAWVLDGDTVIDRSNGRNIRMPKIVYYALGRIDQIGNTHEYSWDEVRERLIRYKVWGPWELRTRSGL